AVKLFYAITSIARNLTERINPIRQHPRQNLHSVVGSSRLVRPTITPTHNYRANFLRMVKHSNPKFTEVVGYSIQPRGPIFSGVVGIFLKSLLPRYSTTIDLNLPISGARRFSIASLNDAWNSGDPSSPRRGGAPRPRQA